MALSWAIISNRLGERFYPPLGVASRASGLPRAAANAVSGRKPGPTLSAEKENAVVPYTPRKEIPPRCHCAALCEAIGRRTGVLPVNEDAPLCGPCRRKAGTESWRPENSVFSIFEANSDS